MSTMLSYILIFLFKTQNLSKSYLNIYIKLSALLIEFLVNHEAAKLPPDFQF